MPVPSGRQIHWLKPQLVAEIEFAGWTEGGNIRQAAFKGLREDKPAREVRAETAASAVDTRGKQPTRLGRGKARRAPRQTKDAAAPLLGVTISNPDKVLWPDAGDGRPVTKRELAEYLTAAGEWLLPHIEEGPAPSCVARTA